MATKRPRPDGAHYRPQRGASHVRATGKAHRSKVSCLATLGRSLYIAGTGSRNQQRKYDLVHVQGVNNFLPPMALASAQRTGIPTVVTFHTGGHSSRLRNMIRETQWQALRPLLRRLKSSHRSL